jgi:hypothetical protein
LEFLRVIAGKDVEVAECYSKPSIPKIQKIYDWMTGTASSDLVQAARKNPKKTRTKKEKKPSTIVKKIICRPSDSELQITSIKPESILGSQELWIFNVESRKLGVYIAEDAKGLSVAGASIQNYDVEKSISKTIRKPAEVVPQVVSMGKVELRHLMGEINSVANPVRSRINKDVLLLRVIK